MDGSYYPFLLLFNLSSILHGFFFYTPTIYDTAEEENMKKLEIILHLEAIARYKIF